MADLKALQVQLQELKTQRNAIMGGAVGSGISPESAGTVRNLGLKTTEGLQGVTESAADILKKETAFKQTQAERDASLLRFPGVQTGGDREGDPTIFPGDRVEVPTDRTAEGGIKSKFIETLDSELAKKQGEADISTASQEKVQRVKDIQKRRVNLRTAKLKIGNNLRSFIDVGRRTQKLTGIKPGLLAGSINKIFLGPTRANEFIEGFDGGLIEVAAAIGANAIPGARAVRLISVFKKTGISPNDTIESAVQTSSDSLVNSIATDMGAEPWEYIDDFKDLPSEDARRDAWNALSREEKNSIEDTSLPQSLEAFEDNYRDTILGEVFDTDPQLLGKDTIARLQQDRKFEGSEEDVLLNQLLDKMEERG